VKHGFVRQDVHVVNFFCFAALALGLVFLWATLRGDQVLVAVAVLVMFGVLWRLNVMPVTDGRCAIEEATGIRQLSFAWKAAQGIGYLRSDLQSASRSPYLALRMERNLRAVVGDAEVASLSVVYSWAAMDGLRLKLYPIVQRYSAYTPYLDRLNADWIQSSGPRFLIFDGRTIDGRNIFAETPAMWLEVYRWYDSRLLGPRNLLLERRARPRFGSLQFVMRRRCRLGDDVQLPALREPVFLTMKCSLSPAGMLANLLWRVPAVGMSVSHGGQANSSRVIAALLTAPTLVNRGPGTLPELATLFRDGGPAPMDGAVEKLVFVGPGLAYYEPGCEIEIYRCAAASPDRAPRP
jgi:hypothetical protein